MTFVNCNRWLFHGRYTPLLVYNHITYFMKRNMYRILTSSQWPYTKNEAGRESTLPDLVFYFSTRSTVIRSCPRFCPSAPSAFPSPHPELPDPAQPNFQTIYLQEITAHYQTDSDRKYLDQTVQQCQPRILHSGAFTKESHLEGPTALPISYPASLDKSLLFHCGVNRPSQERCIEEDNDETGKPATIYE